MCISEIGNEKRYHLMCEMHKKYTVAIAKKVKIP